jgi:hypothetical protein
MAVGSEERVPIRKFDMRTLKLDSVVLFIGKRGTGKSVLLEDTLYHVHKHFDLGIAMSPTASSCDMFRRFIPDSCVYENFDEEPIKRMIEIAHELRMVGKQRRLFVLMDDCMYDPNCLKSDVMRYIFMNGRHLNILLVVLVQYALDVLKGLRANTDYVFTLAEPRRIYRQGIYENFFSVFEDFEDFCQAMDVCTADNGCLVAHIAARSTALTDQVFWYKAQIGRPARMMGNRNLWKLHHLFYRAPVPKFLSAQEPPIPALARMQQGGRGGEGARGAGNPHAAAAAGAQPDRAAAGEHPHGDPARPPPRRRGRRRAAVGALRDDIVITIEKRDVDGGILLDARGAGTGAGAFPPPPAAPAAVALGQAAGAPLPPSAAAAASAAANACTPPTWQRGGPFMAGAAMAAPARPIQAAVAPAGAPPPVGTAMATAAFAVPLPGHAVAMVGTPARPPAAPSLSSVPITRLSSFV